MMIRTHTTIFSVLVLAVALIQPRDGSAGVPTEQIRGTVDRVLTILKDPALNSPGAKEARRSELSKAILPRFDFEEMAKRSLGAEWRRRTDAEQKEFIRLFTELLKNSYIESIESYRGQRVVYRSESQDGAYADVGTKVINDGGEEFTIDYRLNLDGSQWKVYDVIIESVSVVNNYRSQFGRILSRSSFAELLQTIRAKVN
ncbi:MAG: MlaC/ttg2D family ABC transporter substrate-binding protein [Candidatus Binatia bacterium]